MKFILVALGYRWAACAIFGESGPPEGPLWPLGMWVGDLGLTHTGRKWVVGLTPGTRFLHTPIGGLHDLLMMRSNHCILRPGGAC